MIFIMISGYYPEPDPDNSLHYEKAVPHELEQQILAAMGYRDLAHIPPGESDLHPDQARQVITLLGGTFDDDSLIASGFSESAVRSARNRFNRENHAARNYRLSDGRP